MKETGADTAPRAPDCIVVCERRPRLTSLLQRQFADECVHVRCCPRVVDIEPLLKQRGIGVVIVDFEVGPAECLQFLHRHLRASHACPVIVVGSERTADLEWFIRELGTLTFLPQPVPAGELAELCRRQFRPEWSPKAREYF